MPQLMRSYCISCAFGHNALRMELRSDTVAKRSGEGCLISSPVILSIEIDRAPTHRALTIRGASEPRTISPTDISRKKRKL